MEIKLISNQGEWDSWLIEQPTCSFTQSFEWGEVLKREGKRIERIQFVDGAKIFGSALLVKNRATGFEYIFCPKGPVIKERAEDVYKLLHEYTEKNGSIFLRFEPTENNIINDSAKFKKTIDINPRATTILDLKQSEEELLEKMHSKTRYNIRLAEKKGIVIDERKDFETFWSLMNETGKRDGFRLHDKKHYQEIFAANLVSQITAKLNGKAIACVVLVGFGETMTYLFGASDYEHRALMAPYLLQWQAIRTAKNIGYSHYDFFGIAPHKIGFTGADYEYDEKHQYAGVTRFKLGFGGEVVELPGTFDLIISEGKYKLYEALRKLRRLV